MSFLTDPGPAQVSKIHTLARAVLPGDFVGQQVAVRAPAPTGKGSDRRDGREAGRSGRNRFLKELQTVFPARVATRMPRGSPLRCRE